MRDIKSGKFVIPGDKLSVIEEFTPNSGTYENEGVVYSKTIGQVMIDLAARKISVFSLAKGINVPEVGKIVVGIATSVLSSMVTLKVVRIEDKWLSGSFTGVLHISEISFKYTDNMSSAYRVGDVIRAKVVSDKNRNFHLSTKGVDLGVVQAFCSYCGSVIMRKGTYLRCACCGHTERRKTASDYGEQY